MPRQLQSDNADPDLDAGGIVGYIQFRGRQTSVTHDRTGVHFGTDDRHGMKVHRAYPVVDPGAEDVPDDAVARPVAEQIVENNPLVSWGVACEHVDGDGDVCGEVFDTPRGRPRDDWPVRGDGNAADPEDQDQSVGDTDTDGDQ